MTGDGAAGVEIDPVIYIYIYIYIYVYIYIERERDALRGQPGLTHCFRCARATVSATTGSSGWSCSTEERASSHAAARRARRR